jgi:hypothetical protein
MKHKLILNHIKISEFLPHKIPPLTEAEKNSQKPSKIDLSKSTLMKSQNLNLNLSLIKGVQ